MITSHTTLSVTETLDIKPNPKKLGARLLAWVMAKDQAYRDKCHFEELSDEILKDVGLNR